MPGEFDRPALDPSLALREHLSLILDVNELEDVNVPLRLDWLCAGTVCTDEGQAVGKLVVGEMLAHNTRGRYLLAFTSNWQARKGYYFPFNDLSSTYDERGIRLDRSREAAQFVYGILADFIMRTTFNDDDTKVYAMLRRGEPGRLFTVIFPETWPLVS